MHPRPSEEADRPARPSARSFMDQRYRPVTPVPSSCCYWRNHYQREQLRRRVNPRVAHGDTRDERKRARRSVALSPRPTAACRRGIGRRASASHQGLAPRRSRPPVGISTTYYTFLEQGRDLRPSWAEARHLQRRRNRQATHCRPPRRPLKPKNADSVGRWSGRRAGSARTSNLSGVGRWNPVRGAGSA